VAAREVAATLAKGTSNHLHVLRVYDYPALNVGYLPTESASRQQEELLQRTDTLTVQKMDAYIDLLYLLLKILWCIFNQ
jgi:hypothetical protein